MSIEWKLALDRLKLQMFALSLKLQMREKDLERKTESPVSFPFFHYAIVHSLMKEVTQTSELVSGIPLPWGQSTIVPRDRTPPGLIPCAVESGHVEFADGDTYRLGITVVPSFAPSPASITGALQNLGADPARLDRRFRLAGNFEVALIETSPPVTPEELAAQLGIASQQDAATIRLLSPFHGKALAANQYMDAGSFDLVSWLHALHWRTFTLIHGRRPNQSDPSECPPDCHDLALLTRSLFDVAIPKNHPKKGERPYELPGIVGSFSVAHLPDSWWYWLLLGQYLNVGEGTGWGLGRYKVETSAFRERFHSARTLFDHVSQVRTLESARLLLEAEKGGSHKPDPSVEVEEADIAALAASLHNGDYAPGPLHGFEIAEHGKVRAIAVASHKDRLVQRAAVNVLTPIFDSLFNQCSFGYRHGRSRADAARNISNAWNEGFRYALDADISAFFDHVDWSRLFAKLDALFPDEPLVALLRRWVSADVIFKGQQIHRLQGLPLGISVSPLLANLYLDDLDDELEMQGFRLVRYADDFVVLTKDAQSAQRAREASRALLERLGLELNPDKTRVVALADGFSYLGYLFCRSLVIDESKSEHATSLKAINPIVKSTWISRLTPESLRAITKNGQIRPAASKPARELPSQNATLDPVAKTGNHISLMPEGDSSLDSRKSTLSQDRWGLYVVGRDTSISLHYNHLSILRNEEEPASVPLENVSHVVSIGSGRLSSPVLLALGERGIPVFFCKRSGELVGVYRPHGPTRAQEDHEIWVAQSAATQNTDFRLAFARGLLAAKLARQAETLSRFGTQEHRSKITQIQQLAACIPNAPTLDALLGLEGSASRILFDGIQDQLLGLTRDWPFLRRERRPPPDPVNALLSFGYTLLYIHAATALWTAGLLPQIGLLHALKPGHLALASDLVEEFRHEVDRLVVRLINRREMRAEHFLHGQEADAGACRLTDNGRRTFILALDGVLQGQALNDPDAPPGARPPLRRMERQANRLRDLFAGRSAVYTASED